MGRTSYVTLNIEVEANPIVGANLLRDLQKVFDIQRAKGNQVFARVKIGQIIDLSSDAPFKEQEFKAHEAHGKLLSEIEKIGIRKPDSKEITEGTIKYKV